MSLSVSVCLSVPRSLCLFLCASLSVSAFLCDCDCNGYYNCGSDCDYDYGYDYGYGYDGDYYYNCDCDYDYDYDYDYDCDYVFRWPWKLVRRRLQVRGDERGSGAMPMQPHDPLRGSILCSWTGSQSIGKTPFKGTDNHQLRWVCHLSCRCNAHIAHVFAFQVTQPPNAALSRNCFDNRKVSRTAP